jgi:hypothetical protein
MHFIILPYFRILYIIESMDRGQREYNDPYARLPNRAVFENGEFYFPNGIATKGEKAFRTLETKHFMIPLSYKQKEFIANETLWALSGMEYDSQDGIIVGGTYRMGSRSVRLDHILVGREETSLLRHTVDHIGTELLTHAERILRENGIREIVATFANSATVRFLLKNGFTIGNPDALTDDERKEFYFAVDEFDPQVRDLESFNAACARGRGEGARRILLRKKI